MGFDRRNPGDQITLLMIVEHRLIADAAAPIVGNVTISNLNALRRSHDTMFLVRAYITVRQR